LKQKIAITSFSSISPLGNNPKEIWNNYLSENTLISSENIEGKNKFVAKLPSNLESEIENLRQSESKYKNLDPTVLMAILASRQAIKNANWKLDTSFGINIGSSRGATQLFEKYHKEFLETGKTATLASPTSTLGNISSWVAHDLKSSGPEISHSITCSTALHSVLNAVAWLQSGLTDKFLVGGSEAPLTGFTIAQMEALKIYANEKTAKTDKKEEGFYPNRALDFTKTKNSMVLGEAAAMACLEVGEPENTLAFIEGIGYATDDITHNISITEEAICFQKSMQMALKNSNLDDLDAIVMHAPGTIKGDLSEMQAIKKMFPNDLPLLTSNKWKVGHTFGTSGMLSLELAILMLQNNHFIGVPFAEKQVQKKEIKKILINAVGFGGNAVSILIGKKF
jgi:3-oxoacyl-(acyl-carrier-protein) synthase